MRLLIGIVSGVCLSLVAPVHAEWIGDLQLCRQISATDARVACYDRLVDALQQHPMKTDEAIERAPASVRTQDQPTERFGLPQVREAPSQVTAQVTQVDKSAYGKLVVRLSNDQVWRQIDSAKMRLSPGDEVVVRSSSLGSFQMRKLSGGKSLRVRRIN